jgi:hypothetical protein
MPHEVRQYLWETDRDHQLILQTASSNARRIEK